MRLYLVGVQSFDAGLGEGTMNTSEFPRYIFINYNEAEDTYNRLKENDSRGSGEFKAAYLIEMEVGKEGHRVIRGDVRI